jgi:hypothetical protein
MKIIKIKNDGARFRASSRHDGADYRVGIGIE